MESRGDTPFLILLHLPKWVTHTGKIIYIYEFLLFQGNTGITLLSLLVSLGILQTELLSSFGIAQTQPLSLLSLHGTHSGLPKSKLNVLSCSSRSLQLSWSKDLVGDYFFLSLFHQSLVWYWSTIGIQ